MHTHWSQFVPNNYMNPTSEDIKFHIIVIINAVIELSSCVKVEVDVLGFRP